VAHRFGEISNFPLGAKYYSPTSLERVRKSTTTSQGSIIKTKSNHFLIYQIISICGFLTQHILAQNILIFLNINKVSMRWTITNSTFGQGYEDSTHNIFNNLTHQNHSKNTKTLQLQYQHFSICHPTLI